MVLQIGLRSCDRICIGRYSSILVKDAKRCNGQLASGMSMGEYIEFEHNNYNFYSHSKTPHLVVEYLVDDKLYYHALDYPRNSPLIQKGFFGREIIVLFESDNPWNCVVRKDMDVTSTVAKYNLSRPDYSQVKVIDNLNYFGIGDRPISFGFLEDNKSTEEYREKYPTTKSNKVAFYLSLISIIPPVLGTVSIVTAILAIGMAIYDFQKPNGNKVSFRNTIVLSVLSLIFGPLALMSYIYIIIVIMNHVS